jgi:IS5 family transposase
VEDPSCRATRQSAETGSIASIEGGVQIALTVECIAKGKTGKKYEFGNKVSLAVTSRGGWLVGVKSYTGNPYDGHTLASQLEQVNNLIGDKVSEAYVDMGYRGHDYEGSVTVRVDMRQRGRTPRPL